jgi:hypothetical protein
MTGQCANIAFVFIGVLLCLPGMSPAQDGPQHGARKHAAKAEQPAPAPAPAPEPAPPPPTLAQMPASAPQVTFRDGQLTIVARNSTLGDILREVRGQTGAAVEIPSNATERVVGQFGPGQARDVLASLLNGSHFNYVMLGSATNPDLVERVMLMSKPGSTPDSSSQPAVNAAANQPGNAPVRVQTGFVQPPQEAEEMTSDDPPDDAGETENQPDNQANQPEQQQPQPNGQPAIKTPEQLLQELQRQQQVQQQQQQPQPTAPPGFPVPPNQVPPQPQPNPPSPQ